jgi:hypothetical protein
MHIGMITHITFNAGIGVTPLLGGNTKQRNVQQVRFTGIDCIDLLWSQGVRNQVLLDRVGVYQVIHLSQIAPDVPAQLLILLLFQSAGIP